MDSDANASPRSFGADFDPLSEAYLADPYPFLTAAREAAPAFYCEAIDHWIVTRYHDIRHIFRTPALFSAANANSPLRPPCPMAAKALEEGGFRAVPTLSNVDPPAHTRVRKLANIAFTSKRVAEMEGFVRDLVTRFCTERLRAGCADIVRDLAWELPALVLFRILGVPDDEVPRVKTGSWNRILFIYGRPTDVVQQQAAEGMAAFWRYAEGLVESRQQEPREDFISDLVHAQDADGLRLTLPQAATIVPTCSSLGMKRRPGSSVTPFVGCLPTGPPGRRSARSLLSSRTPWRKSCGSIAR
jgi:cytochrome P450